MQSYRMTEQKMNEIFEKYTTQRLLFALEEKEGLEEAVRQFLVEQDEMRAECAAFFASKRRKVLTIQDLRETNPELGEEELVELLTTQSVTKNEAKKAESEAKKAAKKAESEAKKAAKKAESEAKKAAKKAESEAKKAAKKAERKREASERKEMKSNEMVLEVFARKPNGKVKVVEKVEEVAEKVEEVAEVAEKVEEVAEVAEKVVEKVEEVVEVAEKVEEVADLAEIKEVVEKVVEKVEEVVEVAEKVEEVAEKVAEKVEEVKEVVRYANEVHNGIRYIIDKQKNKMYFLREGRCFTSKKFIGKWNEDKKTVDFFNLGSGDVKKIKFNDVMFEGEKVTRDCLIGVDCMVYVNAEGDVWGQYLPRSHTIEPIEEDEDDYDD